MKFTTAIFVCMILYFTLVSCNYISNVHLLSRGSVEQKNFYESIDFENRYGLIVIKGTVNDNSDTLEFIFDTGAFDNKITQNWADTYGLKERATKDKSDAQGNENKISMTLIDKVNLGNIDFKNTAAGIIDYPENSLSPCVAADGIIGANLIREANWKIDFVNNKIWITDDFSNFQGADELTDPIKFSKPLLSGTPKIDVVVNGQELGNILADLGSNGGVDLPTSIKHIMDEADWDTTLDNSSSGIWGTNFDTVFTARSSFNISDNELITPVNFSSKGFAKIGTEVWQKYDVYFNYDKKRMYLKENVNSHSSKPENDFGFIPYYSEGNYWTVENLTLGSVAQKAGLNFGDKILKIDGKSPSDFHSSLCGYFDWATSYFDSKNEIRIETEEGAFTLEK